jgi:predicted permease
MATFGLAVGATVAVLSVIDNVMFRPLPYADSDRLVQIHSSTMATSPARVATDSLIAGAIKMRAARFAAVSAVDNSSGLIRLPGFGDADVRKAIVNDDLLSLLGVHPELGRLQRSEDVDGPVVTLVLSWECWRSRFGGSADLVSRSYTEGRTTYRIIGVLPQGFFLPASGAEGRIDVVEIRQGPGIETPGRDRGLVPPVIARLRPDATIEQARAEVAVIVADLVRQQPKVFVAAPNSVEVHPLREGVFLLYRPYVRLIGLAVGLVLVLASVNLALLLLARLQLRGQEIAIRASLGASRARIARGVILEALLVCGASAAVALLACRVTQSAVVALVPPVLQGSVAPIFDTRILALSALLTVVAALIAGAAPAWRFSRSDIASLLAKGSTRATPRIPASRLLLVVEATLGVLLVAGALVTVRSFAGLIFKHPGFVSDDLYVLSTSAGWQNRWPLNEAWRDDRAPAMLGIARTLPGVLAAGVATGLPLEGNAGARAFWKSHGREGLEFGITGGYFEALGTQVRVGRTITDDDVAKQTSVAVLSESGARTLWPNDPVNGVIGREFLFADGSAKAVVGVVADFNRAPGEAPVPLVFLPFGTRGLGASTSNVYVPVRMQAGMRPDTAEINRRIREVWGRGNGAGVEYVPENLAPWLRQPRFQAVLFGALAAIGLAVAAVGLFAVASFESSRRRAEVGIRMALGATPGDARRLVVRAIVVPVVLGLVAGVAIAFGAAPLMQTFLFEVDARGIENYAAVAIVLVVVAGVAAWLPARRAARTDPATVLRNI